MYNAMMSKDGKFAVYSHRVICGVPIDQLECEGRFDTFRQALNWVMLSANKDCYYIRVDKTYI